MAMGMLFEKGGKIRGKVRTPAGVWGDVLAAGGKP